jgi:hypothetical protein
MTIPIDDNITRCYAKQEIANVRFQERNLPAEIISQIPINSPCAPGSSSVLQWRLET